MEPNIFLLPVSFIFDFYSLSYNSVFLFFFFCFVNVLIGFKIPFYFSILFGKGSCLQYSCLISSSEKSFRKTKILNFSVRSRPTHNPGIYFASIPHLLWPLVITKLITVAHQNREKNNASKDILEQRKRLKKKPKQNPFWLTEKNTKCQMEKIIL